MAEQKKDAETSVEAEVSLPDVVNSTIKRHAAYAAVGGLIPIPMVEVLASGTIQMRMIAQLAEEYGLPFSEQSVKASIAALVGSVLPVTGIGYGVFSLMRSVPLVGPILGFATMPALAAALTWAVGRIFAWHFASGGTIENFDPTAKREQFKREFEEGKRRAADFVKSGSSKSTSGEAAKA